MENEKFNKKYCNRCNRELKDIKSKELGYGKICYEKIQKEKQIYLFSMEVVHEAINKK